MLGRLFSCWRRRLNLLLLVVLAAASGGAFAMDSYDPATGILTIPLVIVGTVAYTNVQVFVPLQNVVSVWQHQRSKRGAEPPPPTSIRSPRVN